MYGYVAMAYREVFLLIAQVVRFESLLLLYNYTKTVSVILCQVRQGSVAESTKYHLQNLDPDRQLAAYYR